MNVAPTLDARKSLSGLLAGRAAKSVPPVAISGIAMDSRQIRPGWLFLACRGTRDHGLRHAPEACSRGAVAVAYEPVPGFEIPALARAIPLIPVPGLRHVAGLVAAEFFDDPSSAMGVSGVTGTNGKTTITTIVAQVLSDWGQPSGVIGTLGYGLYGMLQPAIETTPDPVRLQAIFAGLRDRSCTHVAMEVSSHALDQSRVAGVHFENAVFTNLTRDHLDYHGTMESYRAAKAKLFEWPGLRRAVLNLDDPAAEFFADRCVPGVELIGFGLCANTPAWFKGRRVCARDVHANGGGLAVEIGGDFGEGTLRSRLLGRFNAVNLLAVLAVLLGRGTPFAETLARVAHARTVPGRMETFGGGRQPLVVVDYAHTPDALAQSLEAVRAHVKGKVTVVFGCGGERDRGKRPEMAQVASRGADRIVLTDDNPRGEDAARIVAEIRTGISADKPVVEIHDRTEAIAAALAEAGAGDAVLVAGKGHESVQIVGSERRRYSDRETVRRLLGTPAW